MAKPAVTKPAVAKLARGVKLAHGVKLAAARWSERIGRHFRMPQAGDPAPDHRRLVTICGWAAALGLTGLIVAVQALVTLVTATPGWYEPTIIAIGLVGIASTIGALTSVHQRRLPYALLGSATAALIAAAAVNAAA